MSYDCINNIVPKCSGCVCGFNTFNISCVNIFVSFTRTEILTNVIMNWNTNPILMFLVYIVSGKFTFGLKKSIIKLVRSLRCGFHVE